MELLELCKIWFSQGQYAKIIEAIESRTDLPNNVEYAIPLASAYFALSNNWKDRQLCEKGLQLLLPHEKKLSRYKHISVTIGLGLFQLDQFGLALRYLQKALGIGGAESKLIEQTIALCRRRLTSPTFNEPFTVRAKKAWKAFEEVEARVRKLMQDPLFSIKPQEALAIARKPFEIAMRETGLRLGSVANLKGTESESLVFSPAGHWVNYFKQCILVGLSPQSIQQKWALAIGEPAAHLLYLDRGDLTLDSNDWLVWLGKTKKGYKLSAYCPKIADDTSKELYTKLAEGFINDSIGELARMKYFGKPEVLKKPRKSQPISMTYLDKFLEKKGFDFNVNATAYLENNVPFNLHINPAIPNAPESEGPRHEILEGWTSFPDLVVEYANRKDDIANDLFACGAVPGTIFFTPPVKGDVSNEKNIKYIQKLQRMLDEKCTLHSYTLISIANGAVWCYLDFIAWDYQEFSRVARKFFSENPARSCGIQVFHSEAAPDFWTKQ